MSEVNWEKFKTWLEKRGAVVVPPTNEWEVVRFKTVNGVSVVYTNKRGYLTFTGESEKAYNAYKNNKVWKTVDRKRKSLRERKARLASRDGKKCFACLNPLGFDDLTIEHLLSFSHGGTDNMNNLALLCDEDQKLLGNKPVAVKIELIIQRRMGLKTTGEAGGVVQDFNLVGARDFLVPSNEPPKRKRFWKIR